MLLKRLCHPGAMFGLRDNLLLPIAALLSLGDSTYVPIGIFHGRTGYNEFLFYSKCSGNALKSFKKRKSMTLFIL